MNCFPLLFIQAGLSIELFHKESTKRGGDKTADSNKHSNERMCNVLHGVIILQSVLPKLQSTKPRQIGFLPAASNFKVV